MINVGHSPLLLKDIFLWLWHEASLSRKDIEAILISKGVSTNRTTMYLWLNDNNRASWAGWQSKAIALQEILVERGMSIEWFNSRASYTPDTLRALRESRGLSVDEFSLMINITPKQLLVYESNSSINKKGISYLDYMQILKVIDAVSQ